MFAISDWEETKELVLGWGSGIYTFGPQSKTKGTVGPFDHIYNRVYEISITQHE